MKRDEVAIIAVLIVIVLSIALFSNGESNYSEPEFSYQTKIVESGTYSDGVESQNYVDSIAYHIYIQQVFQKPSPCTNVNYTVVKNEKVIDIIPVNIPKEDDESVCATVIAYDFVEFDIALPKGDYIINFYSWWDKEEPAFSKQISSGVNFYKA